MERGTTREELMGKAATASITLVVLAIVALAACTKDSTSDGQALGDPTARAESSSSGSGESDDAQWLFAVQAQGDSTYDAATGRLSMPAGTVQAFTDRPYRDTRTVTPQAFVNLFHRDGPDSFAEDPPNAVLTYWDDSSGTPTPRTVVCEASGGAGVTDDGLWVGLEILEPAGATLPARLDRASLFVDDVALSACSNSPDHEIIVEYFNEITFNDDVYVDVEDTGTAFELTLSCPPEVSPELPPPSMEIRLATADDSSTATCNTGQITIPKATMGQSMYCTAASSCSFVVTVLDDVDGTIFSTTEVSIPLTGGDTTFIPNLNPATLPICPQQIQRCLLDGTCTLSRPPTGPISLCDSGDSCNQPG
jgi:hypothetical protein